MPFWKIEAFTCIDCGKPVQFRRNIQNNTIEPEPLTGFILPRGYCVHEQQCADELQAYVDKTKPVIEEPPA